MRIETDQSEVYDGPDGQLRVLVTITGRELQTLPWRPDALVLGRVSDTPVADRLRYLATIAEQVELTEIARLVVEDLDVPPG